MKTRLIVVLGASAALFGCIPLPEYERQADLASSYRELNQRLEAEVEADQAEITQLQDRLKVTLVNELLFPSGGWKLDPQGKAVLDKIVPALQQARDKLIEVEGYTDNTPIGGKLKYRFSSNWELSTARATEIVEYLQHKGIDPDRLSARGFGEYQPIASNDTPEGRKKNRRTDIVLIAKPEAPNW
ncbi:MAG TPA: OmpA family protein [Methylococcus sp.]|nr:OmpA family protein [Methylococcus sp.]